MGIPKPIEGSEFKNATFPKLLDKHNIQIIFALGHAPFVEAFNKTIRTELIKYTSLHNTKNWSDFLPQVLEACSNTKHAATGAAPNDVNSKNELQIAMRLRKHAETGNCPDLGAGDQVRLPTLHKSHQGHKQLPMTYTRLKNLITLVFTWPTVICNPKSQPRRCVCVCVRACARG